VALAMTVFGLGLGQLALARSVLALLTSLVINTSNIDGFSQFFLQQFFREFAIQQSLKIHTNLKHVATLPCEILMSKLVLLEMSPLSVCRCFLPLTALRNILPSINKGHKKLLQQTPKIFP